MGPKLVISSNLHAILNLSKPQAFVSIDFNIYVSPLPESSFWQIIFITDTNNLEGRKGRKRRKGGERGNKFHSTASAFIIRSTFCSQLKLSGLTGSFLPKPQTILIGMELFL